MRCSAPKTRQNGGYPIRCRKCMPCRINKKSEWTARILLEGLLHPTSIFITLTYNSDNLPELDKYPGGNLLKSDLQKFFRACRDAGLKFRYFACGEYGEKSKRAHYHAIMFGLTEEDTPILAKAWDKGFIKVGDLTPASAQYTARYTTKKLNDEHPDYNGRLPEFMLSSRKPGLGNESAELIAETLCMEKSRTFIIDGVIRMQGRKLPLDDYMKREISKHMYAINGTTLQTQKPSPIDEETGAVYTNERIEEIREESLQKAIAMSKRANRKESI